MPRISAPSLAEHRDRRLSELLDAGRALLTEDGSVTIAAVAERAGLSRPAVYEYFPSTHDLLAAIVTAPLLPWSSALADDLRRISDPEERLRAFVAAMLQARSDGVLVPLDIALPASIRDCVTEALQPVLTCLHEAVAELGATDPEQTVRHVRAVAEVAARRVSSASDPHGEIDAAGAFIVAGVRGSDFAAQDRGGRRR